MGSLINEERDPRGSVTELGRTECQPHLRIPAIRRLFGGRLTLSHAHHHSAVLCTQKDTIWQDQEIPCRVLCSPRKSQDNLGSMRKRASPVATTLHKTGEFVYTWIPHHRLNAGIIGVGKRLYYQAQSHGCPGLVDFLTARIPIYSLTIAPCGLKSKPTPETQRRTPQSEGHSLRGIISSRIAYYQQRSSNHH